METVFVYVFMGLLYFATLFVALYAFLKPDISDFYVYSLAERYPLFSIVGAISLLCQFIFLMVAVSYFKWWGIGVGIAPIIAAYYPIRLLLRFRFIQKMKRLNLL